MTRSGAGLTEGVRLRARLAIEGYSDVTRGTDKADGSMQEFARLFAHDLGETVIAGTPRRVAAMEWNIAENVLALGMQPVGVADLERMKVWVELPIPFSAEVADLGLRNAPDMKLLASLEPDLIAGVTLSMEIGYDAYAHIAPTIVYEKYPQKGQINQYNLMINSFVQMANILGKTDEAGAVLDELESLYDTARTRLQAAGRLARPFVLAMGFSFHGEVVFRLYTPHSTPVAVLQNVGLVCGYEAAEFEPYGYTKAGIEALVPLQECDFLCIVQPEDNMIEQQMKHNAIWNSLQFVRDNRVYVLGGDMWPYVGPLSAQTLVKRTVDVLINGSTIWEG